MDRISDSDSEDAGSIPAGVTTCAQESVFLGISIWKWRQDEIFDWTV